MLDLSHHNAFLGNWDVKKYRNVLLKKEDLINSSIILKGNRAIIDLQFQSFSNFSKSKRHQSITKKQK